LLFLLRITRSTLIGASCAEGPDDMPAHIKSMLTQTQLTIPVADGRLQLGVWQGIFLFEHRASPHRRSLILTLIGE
jgi:secondary thiamine-phosphate synthase enzyme